MMMHKILKKLYPERFSIKRLKGAAQMLTRNRLLVIGGLLLLTAFIFMSIYYYNTLLSMNYDVQESKAQVDTQLQRRKNILLNMTTMVMDYAQHEREIFKHVVDIRAALMGKLPEEGTEGDSGDEGGIDLMEGIMSKLFALAERYPDLRLSENFQRFMDALVDVETKIADERMIYNQRANDMSTEVGKFPGIVFAEIYGFEPPEFFMPEEVAREAPIVEY